jgi:hypothetical protein
MSYRDFTFEQITATFAYEPSTGKLMRRLRNSELRELKVTKGPAVNQIGFAGYYIPATRIMFMLMTKRWPKPGYLMDHRNGDVFDCRWSNLREVTPSQSLWNRDMSRRKWVGGDGLERGVSLDRGKYRVRIGINGEQKGFGRYDTKEEANEIARKVIREVQGEFSYDASRDTD